MSDILKKIDDVAKQLKESIENLQKPEIQYPIRSLNNVYFDKKNGYFAISDKMSTRHLSANTAKQFAQMIHMMNLIKELIKSKDIATKRDVYYQSKNWDKIKFEEQPESDKIMDDLEAMLQTVREQMGFIPDEHGGGVVGNLKITDVNPVTNRQVVIDCANFGSGAYTIPPGVEKLKLQSTAKFVLAIETAGMFQRLVSHGFWNQHNCILISMGGVPSRACRRFTRRLSDELKLPIYVFTDGDPYGYTNIYRTLKVGSGNSAHINKYFCVPKAQFIGVTPDDIVKYNLPTHKLKDVDITRARQALKNDPFILAHKPWQNALQKIISMGVRCEQQALSAHGLNYVIDTYLPEKFKARTFLP